MTAMQFVSVSETVDPETPIDLDWLDIDLVPVEKAIVDAFADHIKRRLIDGTTDARPRATLARAWVGDPISRCPAGTVVVSLPIADPDDPLELATDLEQLVTDALALHQVPGGGIDADPAVRLALTEIADGFARQAARIRTAMGGPDADG